MKASTKLAASVGKAFAGCVKTSLKGKATGLDCGDPADYDIKLKIGKAKAKLTDSIGGGAKSTCKDGDHGPSLARFGVCPSPGTVGAVAGFADVAACNNQLGELYTLGWLSYVIDPDYAALSGNKDAAKCGKAVVKNALKLAATVGKERGKCQTSADKSGGGYNYGCSTYDDKSKIAGATAKLAAAVTKSCGGLSASDFGRLGLCGSTEAGLSSCASLAATKSAGGLTATAFEYAGVCPAAVDVVVNPGRQGGGGPAPSGAGDVVNTTRLDAGFTGFWQDAALTDGIVGRVELDCTDATCSDCAVTASCDLGNCRCEDDVSIVCDEPFGPDVDDCGGSDCIAFLAPPLPISTVGTPVCVLTEINGINGTADAGTGETETNVPSSWKVRTGVSATQPCPTCEAGVCNGGDRDGLGCSVDATSATFGAVSHDCPPDFRPAISTVGIQVPLHFTDKTTTLSGQTSCDFPLGALTCQCAQCSGNDTIACESNADCAAAGAGDCTASTGATRAPNGCSGFDCSDPDGDGNGECTTGPDDTYCDGFLNQNGLGVAACSNNGDCFALVGGGTCSITARRACFTDPIVAGGDPGVCGAELAGVFCIPPAASSAINGAAGLAGPGRLRIDFDFALYCPDGTTPYELGGSTCP